MALIKGTMSEIENYLKSNNFEKAVIGKNTSWTKGKYYANIQPSVTKGKYLMDICRTTRI